MKNERGRPLVVSSARGGVFIRLASWSRKTVSICQRPDHFKGAYPSRKLAINAVHMYYLTVSLGFSDIVHAVNNIQEV